MVEKVEDSLAECLHLMKNDIGEAIAADEMLYVIEYHINNLPGGQSLDLDPGFKFVVEALAWRMALAINRLFDKAREDRANFARLKQLIDAQPISSAMTFNSTFNEIDCFCQGADLTRLRACRNGFVAHSLRGSLGHRDGVQTPLLTNVLGKSEKFFEDIHRMVTGNAANLEEFRKKWRKRAQDFWRNRLPDQAQA